MVAVFRARDRASRRRLLVLEALLAASAVVTLGVAARVVSLESLETTNLVWNLFLAWIPLVLALVVYDGESVDVVFLDAEKEQYEELFQHARKKLEPGAVVIADNVLSHAETLAVLVLLYFGWTLTVYFLEPGLR